VLPHDEKQNSVGDPYSEEESNAREAHGRSPYPDDMNESYP
jgi:hypothetical protein